jgi:hypothetical protein
MVYTSTPLQHTSNNDLCSNNDCSNKKIISLPFCEHDALRLQEIFVTCGVHTITTKNSSDGRKIIQTILHSLNYFHNIGCLTQLQGLPSFVCDIAKHVALEQTQNNLLLDLETFLTVHPCFDFIWIELSQAMQKKYPIEALTKNFEMYHVQERMPVVFVLYDQE